MPKYDLGICQWCVCVCVCAVMLVVVHIHLNNMLCCEMWQRRNANNVVLYKSICDLALRLWRCVLLLSLAAFSSAWSCALCQWLRASVCVCVSVRYKEATTNLPIRRSLVCLLVVILAAFQVISTRHGWVVCLCVRLPACQPAIAPIPLSPRWVSRGEALAVRSSVQLTVCVQRVCLFCRLCCAAVFVCLCAHYIWFVWVSKLTKTALFSRFSCLFRRY